MKKLTIKDELTEFLLYTTPNAEIKVETYLHDESLWLPQKRMAELFGVQRPAITKHLKNIFVSGELIENEVSSILEHTTQLEKASKIYDDFNKVQKIESDFDKEMKKVLGKE